MPLPTIKKLHAFLMHDTVLSMVIHGDTQLSTKSDSSMTVCDSLWYTALHGYHRRDSFVVVYSIQTDRMRC